MNKFDFFAIFTGYIVFVWLIIFQNIQIYFADFIHNFFGKNITFSGRTYIWEKVIPLIEQKIFLGHGMTESGNIIFMNMPITPSYSMTGFFSCHNTFLQELFYGGIVLLIPLCIFFVYLKVVTKTKDECTSYINISLIGILFVYVFEAVSFTGLFFLGSLLYCYQQEKNIYNI